MSRWPVPALAAALLIAAGCGGGDEAPPVADRAPAGSAPATSILEPPSTSKSSATVASTTTEDGSAESTVEAVPPAARVVLARGDTGEDVTELQQGLVRQGFEIDVDGHFGPATEAAVTGFQYSHGLNADGIAGPATWAMLNAVAADSTVVLSDRGLGVADFGHAASVVMPTLLDVLGTPQSDLTEQSTHECEPGVCEGRDRTVRWSNPGEATFSVRFDELDGTFRLVAWELAGWGDRRGVSLATSRGVALGSTASELLLAYPGAEFGHYPEPACGDAWWNPGTFHIDVDDDDPATGLRGSIDHDWDAMLDSLDAALIAHDIPEGLDCYQDVMCADVFGQFQESVGLPFGCGLDGPTWLALGLPLPPSLDAPVESLRAGQTVTEC